LFFAFSVILTTLVLQGLTLPYLILKFGITHDGQADEDARLARSRRQNPCIQRLTHIAMGLRKQVRREWLDRWMETITV
jgi:NhaP-type Na+/H+ or K+/H+ antiporter